MTKFLQSLLFIGSLGIILFFALKPDPEVPEAMAPSDVRVFFNTFDAFRNQLAFGLFGIAALLLLMGRQHLEYEADCRRRCDCDSDSDLGICPDLDAATPCRYRRCPERVARSRIGLPAVFGCSGFLENCESRRLENLALQPVAGSTKTQVQLSILILR